MTCSAPGIKDLRRLPIEERARRLAKLVRQLYPGLAIIQDCLGDKEVVFKHARKLHCEGIVPKRPGLTYWFGRSKHWLKVKNPAAPAVRREAEEDWRL